MTSSNDSQLIKDFQEKILSWYKENQRDFPWRKTRDPYRILISEIMSQQTQISRVIPKYLAWLDRFPHVNDLSVAPVSEVLSYWSGLGYNRRALNLKKTAEIITQEYNGIFPDEEVRLLALPGIGKYTARAVLCFAFNKQIAVVDTNVKKVILTQFLKKENASDKEIELLAEKLLPPGFAYEWNQALMDYAGSVLSKEKIIIPKQSKFVGSRRYYRGQVIKLLIKQKAFSIKELTEKLQKEEEWTNNLLDELVKEGFIKVEKNIVRLA